jgi:hypothetical protein
LARQKVPRSHDIDPTFRASRQEILNSRRPKEEYFMDKNTETTAPKLASIPKTDAPQAFRAMAEKGTPLRLKQPI